MKRIVVLVFGFMVLFVYSAFAQSIIKGKISDTEGKALIGANVVLANTLYGVSVGVNGEFVFNGLKKGSYQLIASYLGFETKTLSIELAEGDVKVLALQLTPKDILTEEVIVASTRAVHNTPIAFQNIEKNEIQKRNTGQDIPYLLSMTPSITTNSDAGTGIGYTSFRIRGTDLNRINISVDGIPVNDSESHGVWWVNMPDFASSVENIQIQRGVGTSANGAAAFGASINLQTHTLKKEPYAEINTTIGSYNTQKINILTGSGMLKNKFTFDTRISRLKSDGFIDRAWSDLKSFYVSGAYHTKKSILRLNFISGDEHTYQAWDGIPLTILATNRTYNGMGAYTDETGKTQYYDNEADKYHQNHFKLHYSLKLAQYTTLNLSAFYTHGEGYYEQYKENQDFGSYGLQPIVIEGVTVENTDLIRRKWLDNDFLGLVYSLNYTKNSANITWGGGWNKYDGNHFGRIIWSRYASQTEMDYEWYRSKGLKTDWNTFVRLNYMPVNDVNIFADVQFRRIDYAIDGIDDDFRNLTQNHDFNFFNPKAGIYYTLSQNQNVYASFAVGNREPNRSNYTDAELNKAPTAETLYNLEAGYKFSSENFAAAVNFYNMDYKNQLVLTGQINDVGMPIMVNIPKSYRRGIELEAGFLFFDKLNWQINSTLSRNKILSFTEYVDDWDTWLQRSEFLGETNLSFSPEIMMASMLTYSPIRNFSVELESKYVGKQYIDNTSSNERQLDAYFVNNLSIAFNFDTRFVENMAIRLNINNLLNEEYETNAWVYRFYSENEHQVMDGYYPQAGRHFMLSVGVKF